MPFGQNIAPYVFTKFLKRPLSIAQYPRVQDHCISGRYAPNSVEQATPNRSGQCHIIHTPISGFQSELGEVINHSPSNLRIPRDRGKLSPNDLTGAPVHLTQDKNQVPETTTQRNLLSQRVISTNRPFNLTEDSDLFFRARQFDLISAVRLPKGDNQIITLSQSSLRDIAWWIEEAPNWNSNPIVKREIDPIIQTDASLTGLAASSQGQEAAKDSRRSMVPRGENLSHQCTAAESSLFRREVVVANGQHYCTPLYKQIRNHAFAASMSAGDKAPEVYNATPENSD